MDEVEKGCPDNGCSDSKEMQGLPVGAFAEGELHLSWMQMFPSPFMPFILISLLLFSFKKLIRGYCPDVVTSGGNVTHKHFHGNEMRPPLSWPCNQEPPPWRGDQLLVVSYR
jgi:hypothetical protein